MACVSEMKTSGVVVGNSFKTGVSAAVGTSLFGARFTDTSHARDTMINRERSRKIFFITVLCMVAFPFACIIVIENERLPCHWGSLYYPLG
jgi:hypothetical protein